MLAAALAATVCASSTQAQTGPTAAVQDGLTLDQALELAEANAPGVGAADAGVRAAEAQRRVASSLPVGVWPMPGISTRITRQDLSAGHSVSAASCASRADCL